jgi:CHAT domain-containing protein
VFALSRGFLTAGCRRVVASLWSVNDLSTADLMSGLFGRIAHRRQSDAAIDYASSLREAKRALRARPQYAAPFYWAPFVLSGAR